MYLINKVIGGVQSATNTVQNEKYTYDNAKNTMSSIKPEVKSDPEIKEVEPTTDSANLNTELKA